MRRLRLVLAAVFLLISSVASAQNVSDNFNRADGGLGANWTTFINALTISSNTVVGTTSSVYNGGFYSAVAFSNDQFSEATVTTFTQAYPGLGIRLSAAGGGRGYVVIFDAGAVYVERFASGANQADIASFSASLVAGDVIRAEMTSTTITVKLNGASLGTITDSNYADGSPGIVLLDNGASGRALDNWSGGPYILSTTQSLPLVGVGN